MLSLKMDSLVDTFDNFKVSAFSKLRHVNPYVNNTTIGPNRSIIKEQEIENHKETVLKSSETPAIHKHTITNTTSNLNRFLAELESQRQGKVQEAVNSRLSSILEFTKKQRLDSKQELQKQQQVLISGIQQQELSILQALEQHDKAALAQHQQLLQYYQELAERRKQTQKELEERERRRAKINALLDQIKKDQVEFRTVYQEIFNILKSSKFQGQSRDVLGDILRQVKVIPDGMEEITIRCRQGKISENECRRSTELVQEIKGLLVLVKEKVATLNPVVPEVRTEVKPILEPEQPKTSAALVHPAVAPTVSIAKPAAVSSIHLEKFISKSSLQLHDELNTFFESYTKTYEELVQNNAYKQFRFDCQKAVNIPVNAISAVSRHHLSDKYDRLSSLLSGETVEVGETRVCAKKHPQGVAFCTNLLAQKFVLQGDLGISANPEAAFGYAAIIVALWHDNKDFGKLLLAHFYKQCPYLVPFYSPRAAEETDVEFYGSRGYQCKDGVIEQQDKFLRRIKGIMRLYAAIIISRPKKGQHQHPHGVNEGWRWLGAFLNLEPQPEITATMLRVFLEVAGSTLQDVYGKTFRKVMAFVCRGYLPMIQKIDSGGPVTRLEVLLLDYQKQGHFEAPFGMLPNNFW